MGIYKKTSIKSPSPRAKAAGMGSFSHVRTPQKAAINTRIYTKSTLREDPTQFGGFSFGDTGLGESPSILNMGKRAK